MNRWWRYKTYKIFLFYVSLSITKTRSCIDGSNLNIGAVVKPYTSNSRTLINNPESEIRNMVNTLSKRFRRVSLYASHDPASIDTQILKEVAKYNARSPKQSAIRVIAGLQSSDARNFEFNLGLVLTKITESNEIHPGTITGLIISSSDFDDLRDFKQEEMQKIYSQNEISLDLKIKLLSKLARPMHEFRRMVGLSSVARSHPDWKNVTVGIRSGNCEDLESKLVYALNLDAAMLSITKYIDELAGSLDFIICRLMPSAETTTKQSIASLIARMNGVLQFFNKRWPSKKVIFETGWPSDGKAANGVEGSVSSMKEFWCEIDNWSRNNSVPVDVYTAFDGSEYSEEGPITNFGWYIRILDPETGLPVFFEKIHYSLPAGKSAIWIVVLTVLGCITLLAAASLFAYLKVNSAKNQFLTKKELDEFTKGLEGLGNSDKEKEDALRLPYDSAYEIIQSRIHIDEDQLLGKGEFGLVFRGKIDDNNTKAAFKVTQPNCASTSLKSLLSEIKILIHVGYHPNVVSIIGACTAEIEKGKVVIAIELCEGGSLEKYLKLQKIAFGSKINKPNEDFNTLNADDNNENKSEIMVQKLLKLVHEISSGMEHIASKKVIHADLAARNVLLTFNGTAKITDFGLSRRLYEYTNYVKKNQEPMPLRWMALESLEQLIFSTKSDVWSFGVTLYEIFSLGDIPYPGLSWTRDFKRQLREGLRLDRPPLAPSSIYDIMKTCFVIDPKQRPSFTELTLNIQNLNPELKQNEYWTLGGESSSPL